MASPSIPSDVPIYELTWYNKLIPRNDKTIIQLPMDHELFSTTNAAWVYLVEIDPYRNNKRWNIGFLQLIKLWSNNQPYIHVPSMCFLSLPQFAAEISTKTIFQFIKPINEYINLPQMNQAILERLELYRAKAGHDYTLSSPLYDQIGFNMIRLYIHSKKPNSDQIDLLILKEKESFVKKLDTVYSSDIGLLTIANYLFGSVIMTPIHCDDYRIRTLKIVYPLFSKCSTWFEVPFELIPIQLMRDRKIYLRGGNALIPIGHIYVVVQHYLKRFLTRHLTKDLKTEEARGDERFENIFNAITYVLTKQIKPKPMLQIKNALYDHIGDILPRCLLKIKAVLNKKNKVKHADRHMFANILHFSAAQVPIQDIEDMFIERIKSVYPPEIQKQEIKEIQAQMKQLKKPYSYGCDRLRLLKWCPYKKNTECSSECRTRYELKTEEELTIRFPVDYITLAVKCNSTRQKKEEKEEEQLH